MLNNDVLLSLIQQAVLAGNYFVRAHTFQRHGLEGFTSDDVKNAIVNGEIVSRRDDETKCVICGTSSALAERPGFLGRYIHCVAHWDDIKMIVIWTAYRPQASIWATPFERHPEVREGTP